MVRRFRVPGILRLHLEELGVPVPAVLRRAGLPRDLFQQQRILVSTEELFAMWRAVGELSTDPGIGLRLGAEIKLERLHPMVLSALSTESFRAAIDHIARYKRLSAPEEIVHELVEDEWSIHFRWLLAMDVEPPVLMEYCFAWVLTIARQGTGKKITPLRIEFVQPRTHMRDLERYFGCPVVCDAARNVMVFRGADAELPFITRNAELLEMLAPQLDMELRTHAPEEDNFAELVRGAIQQRLTGHRPVVEDIARDLHMSARTLQRRLQESGSSYQRVLDEARRQMARYYLRNSELELTETAYLLGYEDSNSFTRAFRAWEGMAPTHWREAHRDSPIH